jgi:hypothetical protein
VVKQADVVALIALLPDELPSAAAKANFRRVGACVDGPSDARGKVRILTGGSIAIMCPA